MKLLLKMEKALLQVALDKSVTLWIKMRERLYNVHHLLGEMDPMDESIMRFVNGLKARKGKIDVIDATLLDDDTPAGGWSH